MGQGWKSGVILKWVNLIRKCAIGKGILKEREVGKSEVGKFPFKLKKTEVGKNQTKWCEVKVLTQLQ